MDVRLPGLYLLMEDLGGFSIKDLEDRVFIQKAIYILQLFGLDLRFRYRWYLRGPYSRGLSQAVYQIDERVIELASNHELRSEVKKLTAKMNELIELKPDKLAKSQWFELVSSIHFLKHISKVNMNSDNAGDHLAEAGKSRFDQSSVESAWIWLDEKELIDKKTVDYVKVA